jgi:acetyl-CoA acyltransferase
MTRTVIAGYARSPFTLAKKGELTRVRPDDLAAQVIAGLVAKTGVDPGDIEDVIMGCAFPEGEQGFNVARLVSLLAGLPKSAAGATVNRFCGSSMSSVHIAAGAIALGAGEVFVCGGVESMTRVPMMGFNPLPSPQLYAKMPGAYMGMGETAENVASTWRISRKEQEEFALRSQQRTAAAQAAGHFRDEIIPIKTGTGEVSVDGCPRPEVTAESLAELKPAFDAQGTVTAGASSPLTDGASAVLVCSEGYAKAKGLEIFAAVKSVAVCGCDPEIMGIGPVGATKKALSRAGIEARQLDVVELNEAFASQSIACMRELGLSPEQVNLDGGAIALGHPLGATGARIVGKAACLLKGKKIKYALVLLNVAAGTRIYTC